MPGGQGGGDVTPTEDQPFRRQWLNSCYQETLLPEAPWHGIESMIAAELANRVEKQFIHPERKEALLEVLGPQFVETYLSKVKRDPRLLEPPNMVNEERQKLVTEAQSWLNSQMYRAVKDVGYQRILNGTIGNDEPPPGYSEFMQHTFGVFVTGLDRQCYLQEQELTHQKQKEMVNKKKGLKDSLYRVPAPSRFKPASSATSSATSKISSKPSTSHIKSMVQKVEGDPPPLWGVQSDSLGNSVVAILEREPRKFDHVASRLHGRQLPGKLRSYMWSDVLFRTERKRMKEVYAEKLIRERFAQGVARGRSELRLKRETQSPINGLIENTVIETYTKTTSMVDHKDTNHMKETARTLNVLYVYDRSYEPYLVHWLFPLQIAFRNPGAEGDKGEHIIELAMYLDQLNSTCFPKWPQVFAIADQVMNTLKQSDPELHDHLTNIAKVNFKVNPKEFLVQLIHEEKSKAEALYQTTPGSLRVDITATELLANPLIFFRRWIGEGFVSVLDTPGVMYIWDQCFMQGWPDSVLVNTCLALVELLRHKFMAAKNYMGMKEVFLTEPCKLYTCDLQAAWIHLENARDLNDIPFQNRQRPMTPVSARTPSVAQDPHPGLLHPFGIKEVRAKLIVPVEAVNREPWLAQVDPNHLRLFVHLYFGSVKLRSRMSLRSIEVSGFRNDTYGNAVYELFLPKEKFVFENLDLSQYDVERELGANPHAIMRLVYSQPDVHQSNSNSVSVGWARVPLFRRGAAGSGRVSADQSWVILVGDHTFTLHPGDFTETSSSSMPKTPSERGEGHLIGYNSELTAVVYDPRNEPADTPLPIAQIPPIDTRVTPRHPPRPTPTPRRTPVPVPLPTTPTPVPSETEPESDHPPTPLNLEEDFGPWVKAKTEAAARDPAPSTTSQPFDLYVDGLRFIPDNASIVKVTGRILRTGDVDIPDILALPDLDGPARSPSFHYRLPVNLESKTADQNMVVLLRAYSVDINSEKIAVIGSCLLGVFDTQGKNKGKLRVGGHQIRLRSGMPDLKNGVDSVTPRSLDHATEVPGCSLLIRLRPHTENIVEAPKYAVGYYQSSSCKPTESETRIFSSYADNMKYPSKERDMVKRLQQMENVSQAGQGDVSLLTWLTDRLDHKKQTPSSKIASEISLTRCVRYHKKMGLFVKMTQAFGMPDDMVIQCFVRLAPGQTVLGMESSPKQERFITMKHIYESLFQAPAWADQPKEIHPSYDNHSCLIVQIFGLEVKYQMKPDHKSPGNLVAPDGQELDLKEGNLLGWSVVPLFHGNSVLNGSHRVPILKNKPTAEILDQLSKTSAASVLAGHTWNSSNAFEAGSLMVTVWDGHYDLPEVPEMPDYEDLLREVGDVDRYQRAQQVKVGRHLNSVVLDSLEAKHKKQGINGAVFKKEMQFFEKLMSETFYELIEKALLTSGDRPLS